MFYTTKLQLVNDETMDKFLDALLTTKAQVIEKSTCQNPQYIDVIISSEVPFDKEFPSKELKDYVPV